MTLEDFRRAWAAPYADPDAVPVTPNRAEQIVGRLIERGLTDAQLEEAIGTAVEAVHPGRVWAPWNAFEKRARRLVREAGAA